MTLYEQGVTPVEAMNLMFGFIWALAHYWQVVSHPCYINILILTQIVRKMDTSACLFGVKHR